MNMSVLGPKRLWIQSVQEELKSINNEYDISKFIADAENEISAINLNMPDVEINIWKTTIQEIIAHYPILKERLELFFNN